MYVQVRADWTIAANLAASVEAVHFQVGNSIRNARGRNADHVGIELTVNLDGSHTGSGQALQSIATDGLWLARKR